MDKPTTDPKAKKHYFLVATQLTYQKRHIEMIQNLNVMVVSDNSMINQHTLAHIQQAAQMRFFQNVEKPTPEIVIKDVFISTINYLGNMTEEEFLRKPVPPTENDAKKLVEEAKERFGAVDPKVVELHPNPQEKPVSEAPETLVDAPLAPHPQEIPDRITKPVNQLINPNPDNGPITGQELPTTDDPPAMAVTEPEPPPHCNLMPHEYNEEGVCIRCGKIRE